MPRLLAAKQPLAQRNHALQPDLLPAAVGAFRAVFALGALGHLLHFLPNGFASQFERSVGRRPVPTQVVPMTAVIWLTIQVKLAAIQPFIHFQF